MATRIAAIGVNHWHSLYDVRYLRELSKMDDMQIVALQDVDPAIVEHRVKELGGNIASFTDYRQMLSEVKPDYVLALGRHDKMAEVALHLLESRIPFTMEKPMSYNARQLRGVLEKAEAVNGFASVPLNLRYQPFIAKAKELIAAGTYGPLTHFYMRINRPSSSRYSPWGAPWMLDPQIANGGCLRNLGAHGLDGFVNLTGEGEDIEVTGAQLSWAGRGMKIEDYASVLVRSKSGVLGTIDVGNGYHRDGTDGEWKAAFRDAILTFKDGVLKLNTEDGEEIVPSEMSDTPAALALRDAIASAAEGRPAPISMRDCYYAVRLIDLGYIAAGNPYGTAEV